MRENTDKKNFEYGHFLHSVSLQLTHQNLDKTHRFTLTLSSIFRNHPSLRSHHYEKILLHVRFCQSEADIRQCFHVWNNLLLAGHMIKQHLQLMLMMKHMKYFEKKRGKIVRGDFFTMEMLPDILQLYCKMSFPRSISLEF